MNCPGCTSVTTNATARAHTEECRKKLESCLAEDEETKLRSEKAQLLVDNWLVSWMKNRGVGDVVSHDSNGAASISAPAAAARG